MKSVVALPVWNAAEHATLTTSGVLATTCSTWLMQHVLLRATTHHTAVAYMVHKSHGAG